MNYSKIILVGFISAFVAVLTSLLGFTGTIIGSVISSVLYNMLAEALEKPVEEAAFSTDFEWEVAYVFPLIVIACIELLFIFALLAEWGIMPASFLNFYLSIQNIADNNLYRILGFALIIISVYPLVLKPEFVKKGHGVIIAGIGVVFLARGFVDLHIPVTDMYGPIFATFDFHIAIIAFILLLFVILRILSNAMNSNKEFKSNRHKTNEVNFRKPNVTKVHHSSKHDDFSYMKHEQTPIKNHYNSRMAPQNNYRHQNNSINDNKIYEDVNIRHRKQKVVNNHQTKDSHIQNKVPEDDETRFNKSSNKIHFESNDLLDDYKK